jgi:hypothetical protein
MMGLSFTIVAGPRQRSHSQVRVPRNSWPHFAVSDSRAPQPRGPGPRIYIPRNRVVQLYPQALGSLFVASYDLKDYGGGIRPRLHAGADLVRIRVGVRATLRLAVYRQALYF